MRSHTRLALSFGLLLILTFAGAIAESLRFQSQRYGLSFEYDDWNWTVEEHENKLSEFSSAFTLHSNNEEGKQIVLGHHLYHKPAHHKVATFDELYHKANPTGLDFTLDLQESFVINGLEAYFVAGSSPITPFCNVHIAHGQIVWYVWTNSGYKPDNSSLYRDYFELVMSLEFVESAPSSLTHENIYGSSFVTLDFDENHPALSAKTNDFKVAFSDMPNAEIKKKHRMQRDCGSQCMIGSGWNFGTIGTPNWCYCCSSNCGGYQGSCSSQGWPQVCNSGGGAFAGWTSPIPGAWIWCGSALHTGNAQWAADVQGAGGTNVVSSAVTSSVNFAGWQDGGYGNVVMLTSGSYFVAHCHLNTINVGSGGVSQGQSVGTVGRTGCGDCPDHLHFHIRTSSAPVNLNQLPKFTDPNRGWPTTGTNAGRANCAKFA